MNEPTLTPSKSPTLKPSAMSIPPSPPPVFSKSSKSKSKSEKATAKSSKVEKMSMPSYAKSSKKGDTKSSKLMAAVSHLAAISGKSYHLL